MNGSLKWECKIGESCGAAFNMATTAFVASTCELVTRRFLIGAGLSVETHPTVPGTTERPDFAAKNEQGAIKAYVEVTTTNPSAELVGQMNRENLIYEAIDGANIPNGGILGYHLVKAGSDSPPLVPLVSSVEEWARTTSKRQGRAKSSECLTLVNGVSHSSCTRVRRRRLKPPLARPGAPSGSGACEAA